MRLLVISDIHSNFEALKALDRIVQYDEVIFLGDAVNYGPQPVENTSVDQKIM
jgi:Calcineurin-like phosphoesterase.